MQHHGIIEYRPDAPRTVPPDAAVVTRMVAVGRQRLEALLGSAAATDRFRTTELRGRGRLVLCRSFVADGPAVGEYRSWTAVGRIHGVGPRTNRYTRVHLWISAWSQDAFELRIRPVGRHPFNWGRRRLGRYFDLAHLAGDELARVLAAESGIRT